MSESKPMNPKDIIGINKIPIHLWPGAATVLGSLGLLDGALKYGRTNWREAGVRFSIYADALVRHTMAKWEGIDIDPDSGLPQEAHMLACIAIIVDAAEQGQLVDDRAYTKMPGWWKEFIERMTPHVGRLREKYADKEPHHWTIVDQVPRMTPMRPSKFEITPWAAGQLRKAWEEERERERLAMMDAMQKTSADPLDTGGMPVYG